MDTLDRGRPLKASTTWRTGLILAAILISLAAGASFLAHPSPLAPLAVIAAVAGVAIGVAWLRQPVWALCAAMFVVLLPIGLIRADIHSVINRSLAVVALAVWLFDVLARRRRVHLTFTAALMLGFLAWSTATLLWTGSVSRSTTILQVYALRLAVFLFLIPNEIRSRQDLNRLMTTLALAGWVLVVVSLGTIATEGYVPGTRLSVLDVNENSLGTIALLTMTGVLWVAMQPAKPKRGLGYLAAVAFLPISAGLVALSGSRGSAISLVVTLLTFCCWKPTRGWGLLGVLVLALGVLIAPFLFSTTLERFLASSGDTMLGGREALWQASWRMIVDHPWGGVGIGNAPYAVMPYLQLVKSVVGLDRAAVHNPLLTIWAETGFPGILLYLGVLGSAVWSFVRQYRRSRRRGSRFIAPYFGLVYSIFLGYMFSWIKGGGMESDYSYFLILALLLVPYTLDRAVMQEAGPATGQASIG